MRIKLTDDEIEERVSLNQMQARIGSDGVITIFTHTNDGWEKVSRYAHAYILSRIARGHYTLSVFNRAGAYLVKNY